MKQDPSKNTHVAKKRPSVLRRLLIANAIAALALLFTVLAVLWRLGLLTNMLGFFF